MSVGLSSISSSNDVLSPLWRASFRMLLRLGLVRVDLSRTWVGHSERRRSLAVVVRVSVR